MTQKEALMHALEYAESSYYNSELQQKAARAFCISAWLEDKNWHAENHTLLGRIRNMESLYAAYTELEKNEKETTKLYHIATLLNYIFGWGFKTDEWSVTEGAPFVHELWNIINLTQ
jgi:hypothetical protein